MFLQYYIWHGLSWVLQKVLCYKSGAGWELHNGLLCQGTVYLKGHADAAMFHTPASTFLLKANTLRQLALPYPLGRCHTWAESTCRQVTIRRHTRLKQLFFIMNDHERYVNYDLSQHYCTNYISLSLLHGVKLAESAHTGTCSIKLLAYSSAKHNSMV